MLTLRSPGMISAKCSTTISLLDSCSATLVSILMAAWLTGYSPVLTIGFKTRITTSGGKTPAMAAAQASAARSTYRNIIMFQKKFVKLLYKIWINLSQKFREINTKSFNFLWIIYLRLFHHHDGPQELSKWWVR